MAGQSKLQVEKFDSNMKTGNAEDAAILWRTPDDAPFRFSGLYFRKPGEAFRRFPLDDKLPPGVDALAWHTSGAQIGFLSDSSRVRVRVKLGHESLMDHMTKIGSSGFDLYIGGPKRKYYAAPTRIRVSDSEYEVDILEKMKREMREFTLNFPLYSGVEAVEIGLDADSVTLPPSPWEEQRPIVVYGTSITHGGCASRPGMSYTNILSRKWNLPLLNFGFSGSGRGEPYVFEQLAKIRNPRLFLLDYEANAHNDGIRATLDRGLDILRASHPETPIVVLSAAHFNREIRETGSYEQRAPEMESCRRFQQETVERRTREGDRNLYFIDGGWPNDPEWHEYTVDGCHATDLGFFFLAKTVAPHIERILGL